MKDRTSSSYESMCLSDVLYRKCVCLFVIIKIVQQIENELMSTKLQILSKDFFKWKDTVNLGQPCPYVIQC